MAISTVPTLDTITVEALKQSGYPNISAGDDLQVRAEEWVQQCFWDIRQTIAGRKIKALMQTVGTVTAIGVSRYANPDDFEHYSSISILYGSLTGTAQTGASVSITLAASFSATETEMQGKEVFITAGTGVGGFSQISAYNDTTKVATVTPNFTTAPDSSSTYMIIDTTKELVPHHVNELSNITNRHEQGEPTDYYSTGQANADSDETGEFILQHVPDKVYPMVIKYYVNPELIDLSSNLLTTLYRRWRNVIDQKVFYKALKHARQYSEAKAEEDIYRNMLVSLISHESYGYNIDTLQATVET